MTKVWYAGGLAAAFVLGAVCGRFCSFGPSYESRSYEWRPFTGCDAEQAMIRYAASKNFEGPISGESPDAADGLRQPDAGSIPAGSI